MFPTTQTVTVVFPQGSLDLTEMDPLLKGEEEIALVDGTEINVLSNSQILTGKIVGRGFAKVPRDLFDIAVCTYKDGSMVQKSLDSFSKGKAGLKFLKEEIRFSTGEYRKRAPTLIIDPAPEWEHLLHEAPKIVADFFNDYIEQHK